MSNKTNWREYKRENSLLFNSKNENCICSNMYPCEITYNNFNYIFGSSEQLFHYLLFQGYKEVQDKIMKCKGINNGFEVKKICKDYEHLIKDKPQKEVYNYLYEAIKAKANCCKDFEELLLSTLTDGEETETNKPFINLVEFAPWGDTEYGTVYNREKGVYEGENICGRYMMKVREEIKNELINKVIKEKEIN